MTINKQVIKESLGKITKCEWMVSGNPVDGYDVVPFDNYDTERGYAVYQNKDDATFIASAPDYIRYLLGENEHLEAMAMGAELLRLKVGELVEEVEHWKEISVQVDKENEDLVKKVERQGLMLDNFIGDQDKNWLAKVEQVTKLEAELTLLKDREKALQERCDALMEVVGKIEQEFCDWNSPNTFVAYKGMDKVTPEYIQKWVIKAIEAALKGDK